MKLHLTNEQVELVRDVLREFNRQTAPGPDERLESIPARVCKRYCARRIQEVLDKLEMTARSQRGEGG